MCILLKLHYAMFGPSNLFFSKVIKEKHLGVQLDPPPLVKEGLMEAVFVKALVPWPAQDK